jgi:gliding motility-associated lipoprotein GldH
MIRNLSLLISLSLLFISCDKSRVFDQYQAIDSAWHQDSIVNFTFVAPDTIHPYHLFLNIRNNNDFSFNNIFLIVSMENPEGMIRKDTLEYLMAYPDGTLMGKGFSDIKESKLFYKERMKFSKLGTYQIRIQHAVRSLGKISGEERLKGIHDIGFRIESIPLKNE